MLKSIDYNYYDSWSGSQDDSDVGKFDQWRQVVLRVGAPRATKLAATSLLAGGQIPLEILSGRDFLCGVSWNRRGSHNGPLSYLLCSPKRDDLRRPMPFGARPTWLVGHKARVGRFGQRECDRRFRGGAAGAPACYRRADPARFRAARRRVSARRRCPPAPGGAVRCRRRQRTHSRAAHPQKPRLTAGVIWRDHALKIFGTAVLLTSALAITAGPAFALQEPVRQNSVVWLILIVFQTRGLTRSSWGEAKRRCYAKTYPSAEHRCTHRSERTPHHRIGKHDNGYITHGP